MQRIVIYKIQKCIVKGVFMFSQFSLWGLSILWRLLIASSISLQAFTQSTFREDVQVASISVMSGWAAYITNLLASSSGIRRAAIVGYPDGSVWARSEGDNEFKVCIMIR